MTHLTRRRATALIAAAPAAVLAVPARAATHAVSIQGNRFRPATLTVNPGDTVTWTNADGIDHTATAKDKSWTTKSLRGGASGSITFSQKGTHAYVCKWHPSMKGKIIVA